MPKPAAFHTEITYASPYTHFPYRVALFQNGREISSNHCATYALAAATGEAMLKGAHMQSNVDHELSLFVLSGLKVEN